MKIFLRLLFVLLAAAVLYTAGTYGYIWNKMRPLTPLTQPSALASLSRRPQVHMVHAVNTVQRARAKDAHYDGFEIDISRVEGQLRVAHDEKDFKHAVTLCDIFAAVKNPAQKTWWLDLKTELTQEDVDRLKKAAAHFNINPRRMLFETGPGTTPDLLNRNGFPILLQVIDGFEQDGGSAQTRALLNAKMEQLLRRYQPFAIAASIGKYPYLKAYFPHYNKAIYTATTVRPSLKKKFLKDAMFKDPFLQIFMQDEYTWLPF